MKKVFIIVFGALILTGCNNVDDILPVQEEVSESLQITDKVGIKLSTAFVTSEVSMNVKIEKAGKAVIRITDISNRVVSKEEVDLKVGDNILKVYTTALPSSAYRIALYDANNVRLGITDFNKIN
jgi:hypothetical protein